MGRAADPATALEAQRRFAAAAAHELRAPIAHQRALVEVALAAPDADEADLRAMGERVVAGCIEQERLIESLLAFARSGYRLEHHQPIDLRTIAAAALRETSLDGLACTASLEPARTTGDLLLIERLVANLIANAAVHNTPGGWIGLATRTEAGRAMLLVANTGPHVPDGELDRLLRPFQQLDGSSGAGLGLTIVEAVAAAHEARLAIQPRPGGGLEVEIAFKSP